MKKITIAISYIGAITILCMALLTGVDVAGRYVLNKPVQGGFELIELMMVVIIACGVAIATAADDHIRVDSLYDKLSPFGKHLFRLFAGLACMIIFALLSWQGIYGWMDAVDAKKSDSHTGNTCFAVPAAINRGLLH